MILSDGTLTKYILEGKLITSEIDLSQIQAASIDIRLGNSFLVATGSDRGSVDFDNPVNYKTINVSDGDKICLEPRSFMLATTKEYFSLPTNITAQVEGRSSIGRRGLFIQNAGWIDPGFTGEITLELFNANNLPMYISPGRRVGQIIFSYTDHEVLHPYNGKYCGQVGATGSRLHLDKEIGHLKP